MTHHSSILPEIVDTYLMLFESINIPLQVAVYGLVQLLSDNPEYFTPPTCTAVHRSIKEDELAAIAEYIALSTVSYGGFYFYPSEDFFEELIPEPNSIPQSAAYIAGWLAMDAEERVRFLLNSHTQADDADIISLSYPAKSPPFRCSYFVVDHKLRREIIVVIRGSLSKYEFITDLMASAVPFGRGHAHKGMVRTAQNMIDEIRKIVDSVVAKRDSDYRVVLTGHSLGAGVAAILAAMLRDAHPTVKCYAFACPSVFSAANVDEYYETVTTVVNGADLIPRLSCFSVQAMVEDLLHRVRADTPDNGAIIHRLVHRHMRARLTQALEGRAATINGRKQRYWRSTMMDDEEGDDSASVDSPDSSDSGIGSPDSSMGSPGGVRLGTVDISPSTLRELSAHMADERRQAFTRAVRWARCLPVYHRLELEVNEVAGDMVTQESQEPDLDPDDEDSGHLGLMLLPLCPAGRCLQIAPPDPLICADLTHQARMQAQYYSNGQNGWTGWRGGVCRATRRVRRVCVYVWERRLLPHIIATGRIVRSFGGLDKRYMFITETPCPAPPKMIVHRNALVQHHPLLYERAVALCRETQASVGHLLPALVCRAQT